MKTIKIINIGFLEILIFVTLGGYCNFDLIWVFLCMSLTLLIFLLLIKKAVQTTEVSSKVTFLGGKWLPFVFGNLFFFLALSLVVGLRKNQVLVQSSLESNNLFARVMLYMGADPNYTDKRGISPLCFAAGFGNMELCESLLASGADINQICRGGYTALAWACLSEKDELVKFLLENGANPNFDVENPIVYQNCYEIIPEIKSKQLDSSQPPQNKNGNTVGKKL